MVLYMQDKQYNIVDKDTGEVVGQTNNKRSGVLSVVLTILGTVLGFIIFDVVQYGLSWIIALLGQVPFLRYILYYPSDASWAMIVLPGSNGVFSGTWVCTWISGRSAPLCVVIVVLSVLSFIVSIATSNLTWASGFRMLSGPPAR